MIVAHDFKRGQFTYTAADGSSQTVPIDFNPATLEYRIALNTRGAGGQAQQAAGTASAKLSVELLFDTTDTGDDVRSKTHRVELMLRPATPPGARHGPAHAPPMVTFEWGAFTFLGVVDSFHQTMDFFAPNGVPLRAVVRLTMSQPNYQFDQRDPSGRAVADQPLVVGGGNPFQLAVAAGDPFAARGIASANGLESLRAEAGVSVAIGGAVSIGAAAGFSTGGGGGSAGFSASFGASASAGVSASAGAFAGLHSGSAPIASALTPDRLLAATSAPGIAPGAHFDVTGRAVAQRASTFKTDVSSSSGDPA
jgi:hypothetical protein